MKSLSSNRVKTKTRLQYEALECGAASLATILGYFGRYEELADLRKVCGVNRDGSTAGQLLRAARTYGMTAKGFRMNADILASKGKFPCIVFWGFNHYLVVEGFASGRVYLSDPAQGRTSITMEEFRDEYTGVVLQIEPNQEFKRDLSKREPSPLFALIPQFKPYSNYITLFILIAFGQAFCTLLVAGISSTFINEFLMKQRLDFGIPLIWTLFIGSATWWLLIAFQFLILRRMEVSISKRVTAELFRKLFQNPFDFFQSRFQFELASRMLSGMETTQVVVAQLLRFVIQTLIAFIVLAVAIVISPTLSALFLIIAGLNFGINWFLTKSRADSNRKLAIDQGKAYGKGLAGISNLEGLKASGLELEFISQWQASFGNVVVQNQKLGAQMALSDVSASSSVFLTNILIISVGGLLIINGSMSLGTLVAFQFLQGELLSPINNLPSITRLIQGLIGELGRLEDLRKNPDDPLVGSFKVSHQRYFDSKKSNLDGSIKIENLKFSFDYGKSFFINDINLNVNTGERVSLVGGSGSGKSTLMKIMACLQPHSDGKILYDGLTVEQHGIEVIRQNISYVPQMVFVFNGTFAENITLWNYSYTEKDMREAATDAQILDLILRHPDGFNRKLKDNGSDLSGGEKQRLEICRALLRKPKILLLDEGTSALDQKTQMNLLDALKKRNITVVSIDHRLEASLKCDHVYVMEDGALVENGPPKELIRNKGQFFKLNQLSELSSEVSS